MAVHKLPSITVGFLTPIPLLFLLKVLQSVAAASSSPALGWKPTITASFLFALGIALFRPVDPVLYGASLAPSFAVWSYIFAGAARSGNLIGLTLIISFVLGVSLGLAAGLLGWFIRRWSVPSWSPAAPMLAAFIVIVVFSLRDSVEGSEETTKIVAFLQQIRDAEQSYAAGRPDHACTCNGPDLPSIRGIKWRTDYNLGGTNRNKGEHDRFWIVLRCSPGKYEPQLLPCGRAALVSRLIRELASSLKMLHLDDEVPLKCRTRHERFLPTSTLVSDRRFE